MLKPYEMTSVIIAGPKNIQETVVKELHNLEVLHIVEHTKNELADIGSPAQNASKLSEILVKVRALTAALEIKKTDSQFEPKNDLLDIESTAKRLNEELNSSLDELKKTENILAKNLSVKQELEILKDIDVPLECFGGYKSLACFTGFVKNENNINALKVELSLITNKFMLLDSIVNKKNFIALFVEAKTKESASYTLQKTGFAPVNFLNIGDLRGTALNNLKRLEREIEKLQQKIKEIKMRLDNLGAEHLGFLIAAEQFLSEQLEKAEAPLKFAETKNSFLIKGWIPNNDLANSIDRLNKTAKNKIFVHFEPAKKTDKVPVKLKNPKFAKPFEFFIDLYSMPTYREIDPTFFLFLTFPIFFGFMLGDFGYGLITLILFMILRKLMPKAKNFFNILVYASLSTMFFGLLFGEFFGFEEIAGIKFPHLLSRAHQINELMYLAVAVGAFHINLGLIIGFVNELKSHGIITALLAKGSWFVLEIGILLVALSSLKIIFLSAYVGILIALLAAVMLYMGEGIRGPIEIPSIFSNTLSYARLMAIGLSSVVLAMIINDSAKEFFAKGGLMILAGVLILAVGHAINILLGLLGSFLHSLRLHYVEFFTKFFNGGAKRYQPFGAKV